MATLDPFPKPPPNERESGDESFPRPPTTERESGKESFPRPPTDNNDDDWDTDSGLSDLENVAVHAEGSFM